MSKPGGILVLTEFPWCDVRGGAFIMRFLVDRLKGRPIRWHSMSPPRGTVDFDTDGIETRFEHLRTRGNVRLRLESFWRWYRRSVWAGQVADRIAKEVKEMQPDVVWLLFDYGITPVALRLLPMLGDTRLHVSIHDEPHSTAERDGNSAAFLREVKLLEHALEQRRPTADAVSEELLELVLPGAQKKSVVTMAAVPEFTQQSMAAPARAGELRIGYSGNFHGEAEFESFISGLELWSANSGRKWSMDIFGKTYKGAAPQNIRLHGIQPIEEVRRVLNTCDVLLLPSPLQRKEMMTNMPTKLVTYLEVGKTVFTFAPVGSATARVVREGHLGPLLHSIDPRHVRAELDKLMDWDMQKANDGRNKLLGERFCEKRIINDMLGMFDTSNNV